MLRTRWSTEAWPQVRAEFKKALASESDPARGVVQLIVTSSTGSRLGADAPWRPPIVQVC